MEEDNLPDHINNLWEDMDRLNALYEELMWPHDAELEFSADYENNRIIKLSTSLIKELKIIPFMNE